MDKKKLKKRLRVVLNAIRNASGTDRIKLEQELDVLTYIIEMR